MTIINEDTPIVVGVESKQTAALRYAIAEAESRHCGVRVIHAYGAGVTAYDTYLASELTAALEHDAETVLGAARDQVQSCDFSGPVEYSAQVGAAASVLTEASIHARLVVLGPDDNAWYERFLTGDVGASLLKHAKCPVVVVPEHWFPHTSRRYGVIVTVGGATNAHGPLSYAFGVAERSRQDLHVLHVVPARTSREDEDNHRRNISEVLSGWSERFPTVKVLRSLVFGEVDEACSGSTKFANLVVMGRPQAYGLPLGITRPVATAVVKEARCPVAVVPADYTE